MIFNIDDGKMKYIITNDCDFSLHYMAGAGVNKVICQMVLNILLSQKKQLGG